MRREGMDDVGVVGVVVVVVVGEMELEARRI